jgi:phage terminase small subunit
MTMTAKRLRFIEEYLVDLNPRAAAQRAGYAAAVGYNLLYKPEVAAAVREAQAERTRRTRIGVDRVVRELAAVAFSDIRNAASWKAVAEDADGPRYRLDVKDSARIDEGTSAAIQEIRRYSWGAVRIKLHDKLGALALLGRHLGMFVDRHEIDLRQEQSQALDEHIRSLSPAQRAQVREAIRTAIDQPAA